MTAYPSQTLTRTTLGQLCATLWDSQSRLVVIQPGIKPGSVVTPLALICSALDCCATREPVDDLLQIQSVSHVDSMLSHRLLGLKWFGNNIDWTSFCPVGNHNRWVTVIHSQALLLHWLDWRIQHCAAALKLIWSLWAHLTHLTFNNKSTWMTAIHRWVVRNSFQTLDIVFLSEVAVSQYVGLGMWSTSLPL